MFYFPKKSNASAKEWQYHDLERTPQLKRACLIVIGKHRRGVWDNSIKFSSQLSANNNDHHGHLVSRGDLTKLLLDYPPGTNSQEEILNLEWEGGKDNDNNIHALLEIPQVSIVKGGDKNYWTPFVFRNIFSTCTAPLVKVECSDALGSTILRNLEL